jgi:hypothetical protein
MTVWWMTRATGQGVPPGWVDTARETFGVICAYGQRPELLR